MRAALSAALFLFVSVASAQPDTVPPPKAMSARNVVRTGDTIAIPDGKYADLKVDVPSGASVVWRFYPPPVQRSNDLPPGRLVFIGERGRSYVVTAVVIDFTKKTVTDTEFDVVFAGKVDPSPEPDPKPKPKPEPEPKPGPVGTMYLVVVEETSDRTPETAKTLGDLNYWAGLKSRDVKYRLYDKDSAEVKSLGYLPYANKAGLPALLTMDKDGVVIDSRKLPSTTAGVDALLKGFGR